MQINANYDLYKQNYLNGDLANKSVLNNQDLVRSKKLEETLTKDNASDSLGKNSELNSKERNFFKQMFPESSMKIDNHILFNRNGKTVNANTYSKGMLVDAAV
ncbi:hypothetical protein OAQ99_00390 [Candidatus Kapabacteria bacterium]|nr:hypothetical protein [Candidatus Kapabacteria bacterium]